MVFIYFMYISTGARNSIPNFITLFLLVYVIYCLVHIPVGTMELIIIFTPFIYYTYRGQPLYDQIFIHIFVKLFYVSLPYITADEIDSIVNLLNY